MSQIENSRICPIATNANQRNGQSHSVESTNPFLKTPLRSVHQFSNSTTASTSTEKRLNYALQSRKTPSDDRTNSEKNLEFKSEAFQRDSKNRSTFEFWQQFHSQRESEPNNEKEPIRVISASSSNLPESVEHLQAAICNVNLGSSGDGTLSVDNNIGVSTRSQPTQKEKLDAREVETVQNEGGDEVLAAETAASTGTGDNTTAAETIAEASSSAQQVSTGLHADEQQQLQKQSQQQNPKHKPILKRQDAPLSLVTLPPPATLPPPILKKRDSFSGSSTSECHSNAPQSLVNNVQNGKIKFPTIW